MLFSSVVASRNDYMDPVLPQSYAPGNGMAIKDIKSFGVGVDLGNVTTADVPTFKRHDR
jgi:hypothetical protein